MLSWLWYWYRKRCERIDVQILVPALREEGERRGLKGAELEYVVTMGVLTAPGPHFIGCPFERFNRYYCAYCKERAREMART